MKKILVLLVAALCFTVSPVFAERSVGFMSVDELKDALGSDNLIVLDVRSGRDWSTSEFKIPGAIRASGGDFDQWGDEHPKDSKIVLYCA